MEMFQESHALKWQTTTDLRPTPIQFPAFLEFS